MSLWLQFVGCSALIVLAGTRLSRYGDVIAARSGLGGTWIGVVLMASVTSLPELVTGASSIVVYDVPDIAAGDVIGSCMFNLLILSLLDVRNPVPLPARVHRGHVLAAAFGSLQLGLVAMAMIAGTRAPSIGWVGIPSLVFLALYTLAMRTIFRYERIRRAELVEEAIEARPYAGSSTRLAALYTANALVIVGAAAYLPGLAERIAKITNLGQTFVGTLFVALSTSLPEIVVSTSAARLGAVDMAVGNLFGSNLFNIAILGVDDVLFTRGALLATLEPVHLLSALGAISMTAVAMIGLTYRASYKRYRMSWDAIGIVVLYVVTAVMLYRWR